MGIASKTISEAKEGKQIALFELSDPNVTILFMPLHKLCSIFVQVCLCCFRAPWFSWWGHFTIIMKQFGLVMQLVFTVPYYHSTMESKEAVTPKYSGLLWSSTTKKASRQRNKLIKTLIDGNMTDFLSGYCRFNQRPFQNVWGDDKRYQGVKLLHAIKNAKEKNSKGNSPIMK